MMRRVILLLTVCAATAVLAQTPADTVPPPNFPPSDEVHISPAGHDSPSPATIQHRNYWLARGYSLKWIIQEAYHFPESRLVFPPELDDGKTYDVAIVPRERINDEEISRRLQKAVKEHFHLTAVREKQTRDVYVLTAPNGLSPAMKDVSQELAKFNMYSSGLGFAGGDLSGQNVTIATLVTVLERHVHGIVVDETNLKGAYDFDVKGSHGSADDTITAFREKLGLVLTRARRDVEVLVVKPE